MLTLSVVKSIQISLKLPQKQGGNNESLTGPQDKQTHSITPNGAVHLFLLGIECFGTSASFG